VLSIKLNISPCPLQVINCDSRPPCGESFTENGIASKLVLSGFMCCLSFQPLVLKHVQFCPLCSVTWHM